MESHSVFCTQLQPNNEVFNTGGFLKVCSEGARHTQCALQRSQCTDVMAISKFTAARRLFGSKSVKMS